jgi:hypothetical protein
VTELVAKTKTTFMQAFAAAAGDSEKRCRYVRETNKQKKLNRKKKNNQHFSSFIDQWVNQFSTQFCAADRSGTVASAAARAMVRLLAGKLLAFTTNGSMIEKYQIVMPSPFPPY